MEMDEKIRRLRVRSENHLHYKKKKKTKTALVTIGLENEKNFENTQDSKGEYLS